MFRRGSFTRTRSHRLYIAGLWMGTMLSTLAYQSNATPTPSPESASPSIVKSAAIPKSDTASAPPTANNQLTPAEEALIAADRKDLSPDERIARAAALRQKIMQNPESPQAKALEAAAQQLKEQLETSKSATPGQQPDRTHR